jgi:hypothetical protein
MLLRPGDVKGSAGIAGYPEAMTKLKADPPHGSLRTGVESRPGESC